MASTAKRFETRSRTALVSASGGTRSRACMDPDKRCDPADWLRRRNLQLQSLFRCGFQEQRIQRFALPVRLFVRRGSQTEGIRARMRVFSFCHGRNLFVSIQRNPSSSKKKPTCRAASDKTSSPLSLPMILNFRYGRLVNWLLHTPCHSSIPKMYY